MTSAGANTADGCVPKSATVTADGFDVTVSEAYYTVDKSQLVKDSQGTLGTLGTTSKGQYTYNYTASADVVEKDTKVYVTAASEITLTLTLKDNSSLSTLTTAEKLTIGGAGFTGDPTFVVFEKSAQNEDTKEIVLKTFNNDVSSINWTWADANS